MKWLSDKNASSFIYRHDLYGRTLHHGKHATCYKQESEVAGEGGSFSFRLFVMLFDISRTRAVTTVGVGSEMGISFPSKNNFFQKMKF